MIYLFYVSTYGAINNEFVHKIELSDLHQQLHCSMNNIFNARMK